MNTVDVDTGVDRAEAGKTSPPRRSVRRPVRSLPQPAIMVSEPGKVA